MKEDPRYMLDLVKRQLKRKREEPTLQRADLERTQRDRYALQLAAFLKEAFLPVSLQLEVLDDPNKGWIRIFGARRSKTLRNRYRSWNRFRSWMVAYNGHVWPRELKVLIDYIEESINTGCSISLPSELQAALTVLEQVGRVPEDRMWSKDPTWLGHLASWKVELESQSRAPVSAKPYSTALLLSLELYLLDEGNDRYFRFVAFSMLISAWTAMRVDDVQNVLVETCKLSTRGLSLRLSRTKTSGPGKLHGQLAAFVHRKVCLSGKDWMSAGMELLQSPDFAFTRDYLVPAPTKNWSGAIQKLLEPPAVANMFRMVLGMLGCPRFYGGQWVINPAMLLVPEPLLLFWTGHSPRHYLVQAAVNLGIPKERRDFIGRWSIGRVGSNSYIHTARQVVEGIQLQVVQSILVGPEDMDETELLDEMVEFADKNGAHGSRLRLRHQVFFRRNLAQAETANDGTDDEEVPEPDLDTSVKEIGKLAEKSQTDSAKCEAKFFITVSQRSGLRRLHAHGKCPVQSERCLDTVDLDVVKEGTFDVICGICKKRIQIEVGCESDNESSSSGETASTGGEVTDGEDAEDNQ